MASQGDITPTARQIKFMPNKPSTRKSKQVSPKIEEIVEADECPQYLIGDSMNICQEENPGRIRKVSTQVAFGPSSQVLRIFEKPRQAAGRSNSVPVWRDSAPGDAAGTDEGVREAFTTDVSGGLQKQKKYREPWDYENIYYPISLPLRRPNSGDPEILDEAEFGKASTNLDYDENSIDAASELGLREKVDQQRMFFFQFPSDLPAFGGNASIRGTTNRPARGEHKVTGGISTISGISNQAKGKEIIDNCNTSNTEHNLELTKGFMGKMLVYKSGAVKLKLGEIRYDVSPGSDCSFAQHVTAMNTTKKYFCELGELDKRAVVTPDIDALFESMDE